ncbi:MAG TPA: exosortase system-associated protein, TIGR04073 family [Geobacteraceae bacterium]
MPYRHLATLFLATLLLAAVAVPVQADNEGKIIDDTSPQVIVDAMAAKGVRGVANIFTGWLEIPKQIDLVNQESGWERATVIGPFRGIGMAVVRTVAGVGELATFFIPYPGFFSPWFEPRFVWQREK